MEAIYNVNYNGTYLQSSDTILSIDSNPLFIHGDHVLLKNDSLSLIKRYPYSIPGIVNYMSKIIVRTSKNKAAEYKLFCPFDYRYPQMAIRVNIKDKNKGYSHMFVMVDDYIYESKYNRFLATSSQKLGWASTKEPELLYFKGCHGLLWKKISVRY